MTEPSDKLVEELAEAFCIADWGKLRPEQIGPHYRGLAQAILPIHTREIEAALLEAKLTADTLLNRRIEAAYHRGLRDAAAICDEVAALHEADEFDDWRDGHAQAAREAAKRIRKTLP